MKRDRREDIIEMLYALSKKFPTLRLGQIIVNAIWPKEPHPTLFYKTDEDLRKDLIKLFKEV